VKWLVLLISFNAFASMDIVHKLTKVNIDYYESQRSTINANEALKTNLFKFLPTVRLYASKFEAGNSFAAMQTAAIDSQGFSASWNIFNFFQDTQSYRGSRRSYASFKAYEEAMKLSAERSSMETVLNYLVNKEKTQIKKRFSESMNVSLKVAEKKFKAGRGAKTAVDKIEMQIYGIDTETASYLANATYYYQGIIQLIGEGKDLIVDWPFYDERMIQDAQKKLKQEISTKKNPSLMALKNSYEAQDLYVKSQKISQLGGVNVDLRQQKSNLDGFTDWDSQLSITYSLPLLVGNEINSRIVKSVNEKAVAKLKYEQKKQELKGLAESMKLRLKMDLDNYTRQRRASSLSQTIYQKELSRFEKGLLSVNDLLFEQQRVAQAQLSLYENRKKLIMTITDYCHLQGTELKSCLN
jgi:outer membrane protein TolC